MRAARTAAFFELSTPTQATGTPGGIWTIASRASSPSSTDFDERSGTPMTGSSVCAATTPGSAAASPAPAISTRMPREAAVVEYSATSLGLRWAESTLNSQAIPRVSSSFVAASIASRSDSEPTRIPTCGPSDKGRHPRRDVAPVLATVEPDQSGGFVGAVAGLVQPRSEGGHVQDPATVRDEPALLLGRPRVEDAGARCLGLSDACDRRSAVSALRVFAGRQHDGDRGLVASGQVDARQLAAGGRGERCEQVALEPRQEHLCLGIAEAAIELEHAPAFGREHQARVEQPAERRASPRQL